MTLIKRIFIQNLKPEMSFNVTNQFIFKTSLSVQLCVDLKFVLIQTFEFIRLDLLENLNLF